MSREDRQILFTALGFLAVVMREGMPREKQAMRARAMADLIEAFCRSELPQAFAAKDMDEASCL